jgi:hypothetical protein
LVSTPFGLKPTSELPLATCGDVVRRVDSLSETKIMRVGLRVCHSMLHKFI